MNTEPCILPVKPGRISEADRLALAGAGVIVFEHPNPSEVRLLRPSTELDSGDLFFAAMQALNTPKTYASDTRQDFAVHVLAALQAKREKGQA